MGGTKHNRNQQKGVPFPSSLFKSLRGEYKLDTKDSIMWGQMHESIACDSYIKETGNIVEKTGLHLFECGFLGSSPDGMVFSSSGEKGVLEIKCPHKYKDVTVDQMVEIEFKSSKKKEKKDFFLRSDGSLNERHPYWHQIQAEMFATSVRWADLAIWTLKDLKIIRVSKDDHWEQNIDKLVDFYLNELIPNCYMDEQ